MALLARITTANAQGVSANAGRWESNDNARRKISVKERNEFTETGITVNNGAVIFSNLPETKKVYSAMITDGEGEFVKQKKISPADNHISLNRISRGLYFVTIVYKNKGQRTFAMNL
ncbi:MAG: C-terminal target protein [Flavipsychrobacter sp.]|nr:C-terminal target protein [Flavipsychrobacter sp.]